MPQPVALYPNEVSKNTSGKETLVNKIAIVRAVEKIKNSKDSKKELSEPTAWQVTSGKESVCNCTKDFFFIGLHDAKPKSEKNMLSTWCMFVSREKHRIVEYATELPSSNELKSNKLSANGDNQAIANSKPCEPTKEVANAYFYCST